MTVLTEVNKVSGNGNGVATLLSFSPIQIYAASEIEFFIVSPTGEETEIAQGTGPNAFEVAATFEPNKSTTGSVRYPQDAVTPLPSGWSYIINRRVSITQSAALRNQGGYLPQVQEEALDRLTMVAQQQQEELDRSVKISISSTTDVDALVGDIEQLADISADISTVAAASASVIIVATNITDVSTVAANIADVNNFAARYRIAAADPTTDNDAGDLVFNTTDSVIKFYNGSSWRVIEPGVTSGDNITWTGDHVFQGVLDVTNINAENSSGGSLRTAGGASCLSWGVGGGANITLGGNMSGANTHKLVNMAEGTETEDYVTKGQLDNATFPLLDEDDMSSDSDTSAPSQQSVKAYVDNNVQTYTTYESGQLTITSGGLISINHGLGGEPTGVTLILRCNSSSDSYSTGDRVIANPAENDGASGSSPVSRGAGIRVDSSSLNIRLGSDAQSFGIVHKTSGGAEATTNSNWRLIVKAWRL